MSKHNRESIYWNNEIVGYVDDLSVDNFHLYGKWISANTTAAVKFLEALSEKDAELWIGYGENKPTHRVTVESFYHVNDTDFIDMVWSPNPPSNW